LYNGPFPRFLETLKRKIKVWQDKPNKHAVQVHWRFTAEDARVKLKLLYSSIQN